MVKKKYTAPEVEIIDLLSGQLNILLKLSADMPDGMDEADGNAFGAGQWVYDLD